MSNLSLFEDKLKAAGSILIATHINPDGDALGSIIAMKNVIKEKFNKDADAVFVGKYPDVYKFLPLKDELISVENFDGNKVYDVAIALDVAAKERLSVVEPSFDRAKYKVNIDHHKTNIKYGDFNFVDGDASSTGEILSDLFEQLSAEVSKTTAIALYTSILTDTGCFKFKNTTNKAMKICADLLDKGADPSFIAEEIYEKKPKAMVMLNSYAVANAKFLENNTIAYATATMADLEKFGAEQDHTEGIVEILRQVDSVKVAMLFKEVKNGFTKVSFRSKDVDVAAISKKFDGGGHTNAAGCTVKKPLNIAIDKVLDEVKTAIVK